MKIHSLKCVNCGAGLDVSQDINTFACSYCGVQQEVERSGGIVSLRRLEESLDAVRSGTSRTASELAISRLQADVLSIRTQRDNEIRALHDADNKSNSVIGWTVIIGVIAAIMLFGWWSMLVIAIGLVIGWRYIPSNAGKAKIIAAHAEANIEPLQVQIARHQSIIDSYDFGDSRKRAA